MRTFRRFTVNPGSLIGLALLLLVVELRWIGAFFISAAFHECCHLAVLRLLSVPVYGICAGLGGAKIETASLTKTQELLSSLAGPIGGFLLLILAPQFPRLAVCAFFHSVCNLIPLYPLDGGRALRCVLPGKYADTAERIIVGLILLSALRITGYIGCIAVLGIIGRPLLEKHLAKKRLSGYNRAIIK